MLLSQDVQRLLLTGRFGKDTVIALATVHDGAPSVRYVECLL